MNSNYIKGRRKEYKLKKDYEQKGYLVLRMAGSHGFSDLVAIDIKNKKILFIQVKPDKFSDKEKKRLEKKYKSINKKFLCNFLVE